MASKPAAIAALVLCLAGQSNASRIKNAMHEEIGELVQDEDYQPYDKSHEEALLQKSEEATEDFDEDEDCQRLGRRKPKLTLDDMKPGTPVMWRSRRSGKTYRGVVQSAKVTPMVTLKYKTKKAGEIYTDTVPLEEVALADDDKDGNVDERPSSDSGYAGAEMNLRQRFVCDVCLKKLRSCSDYKPSAGILNPVRPPPESLNGRNYTCPPSERELWSSDERLKVVEDGTPGEGEPSERAKCPSERRASPFDGKLFMARRICDVGLKWPSYGTCSDLVNKEAPVFGRRAECTASVLRMYN